MDQGSLYLSIRLIAAQLREMNFKKIEDPLEQLESLISETSDTVEWDEIDKIYAEWFEWLLEGETVSRRSVALMKRMVLCVLSLCYYKTLLTVVFGTRSGDKMPTVSSRTVPKWLAELATPTDYCAHRIVFLAIYACENVLTSLLQSTSLYEGMRPFLSACDLALARVASQYLGFRRFLPTYFLTLNEECKKLMHMIHR